MESNWPEDWEDWEDEDVGVERMLKFAACVSMALVVVLMLAGCGKRGEPKPNNTKPATTADKDVCPKCQKPKEPLKSGAETLK